jgi:S-formylglutathione hydrolase FrmB
MGGYGALKIALKHPELFGSVSTLNGFTSFEDMVQAIIDRVFDENGVAKGDVDGFYNMIDTAYNKPFTNLVFSMAAAFSPHDTVGTLDTTLIERYQVDLPFDANGNIVDTVFNAWLAHDLASDMSVFLANDMFGHLDSTELYVEYSDADQYLTGAQAASFMDRLSQVGVSAESHSYSGYEGYPAGHDAFNIQRIEEMLKFHSRHLSGDPGQD